ncbi:MAG: AAA family ATPase, partial [Lachnospiraceae bacterium]|nr:AAA family ATPase [Lachnospiraceae bacterium]
MNEEKIEKLRERLLERNNEINVILQLEKYELGTLTLTKILDRYGDKALDVINENPYRLAMDIEGIGFNICDKIAKMNGFSVDNEKRTMAGIIYILENEYSYGNVYVTREVLEKETIELLKLDDDFNFDDVLYNLEISLKIKRDKFDNTDLVFLKSAYNIEKALTEYLYNLKDNIVIVTGGPGTGKTYNIKQYLNDAREVGLKVALCAPTGRATKRITEVTGY